MATPEYYPDLHTLSRHDALPFSSRNRELSVQKTDGTIRWRANIFRNHVKNYIYGRTGGAQVNENGVIDLVTSNNEFLQRFWSQGEATIRGAEAEISYNLHGQGMSLRGFADTSRGTLSNAGNLPLQPTTSSEERRGGKECVSPCRSGWPT